jgi:VWFA-related protein
MSVTRALVVCLVATAAVAGQSQPPRAPQTPVFRSETAGVFVDFAVRDARGRFIQDLKPGEVVVLEDGVAQKILSMSVSLGGQNRNVLAAVARAAPSGVVMPPPRSVSDTSGRVWVIFIDDLHLPPLETPQLKDVLKKIATTLVHDGDRFCLQTTGPSAQFVDLTYDKRRLTEAFDHIMGAGQRPSEIISAPDGAEGPVGVRYLAHRAFSTAYDLLVSLEKLPAVRKGFVYVSSGYSFDPFPKARAAYQADLYALPNKDDTTGMSQQGAASVRPEDVNPFNTRSGQQFADADLQREIGELTREANRANVSFFPIDPHGLDAGPSMADDRTGNVQLSTEDWTTLMRTKNSTLRVMADQTGGFAIVNTNAVVQGLNVIDSMMSDNYVIGYQSSNLDPLRRTRKIEIKVTRPGAVVTQFRSSYSLKLR